MKNAKNLSTASRESSLERLLQALELGISTPASFQRFNKRGGSDFVIVILPYNPREYLTLVPNIDRATDDETFADNINLHGSAMSLFPLRSTFQDEYPRAIHNAIATVAERAQVLCLFVLLSTMLLCVTFFFV